MKKTIQRHQLSPEEKSEAARLRAIWDSFKANNSGASQEWLGTATGIGGQSAVSQYLRGELALNFANLIRFCNVLGANPSDISPRLVHEHLGDPALNNDLYARTSFAAHGPGYSPIKGQKSPLSDEARDLISCVARLDGTSPLIGKTFKLAAGLLLLSAKSNELQDARTTEEMINDAETIAANILGETQLPGVVDEQGRKKNRRHS